MLKKGCLPTNKSALHQTPPNATQPYLPPIHQYFQSELESPQQKSYHFQVVINRANNCYKIRPKETRTKVQN